MGFNRTLHIRRRPWQRGYLHSSKEKPQRYFRLGRIINLTRDRPEGLRGERLVRQNENGRVGSVESFQTELQPHHFRQSKNFEQRKVEIAIARPAHIRKRTADVSERK